MSCFFYYGFVADNKERTRERFGEFVMRMKNALAALTGIGI